jgi:hypothetical protein
VDGKPEQRREELSRQKLKKRLRKINQQSTTNLRFHSGR